MAETRIEQETDIYDLGEIKFGDTVIPSDSFKLEQKVKLERRRSTSSYDGTGWKISEREFSWEISDVEPQYYDILDKRFDDQTSDKNGLTITAYNFKENGDYEEVMTLYACLIESISSEQDSGAKLTVKGEALRKKVKK